MDRLWTPWRYSYVTSTKGPARKGVPAELDAWPPEFDLHCVFCNMIAAVDYAIAHGTSIEQAEKAAHIVHRGPLCFLCLNAFPYSTGHLMVVPYCHADSLADLPTATAQELIATAQHAERCLRQVYNPDGINLGMNLGEAAGAGVADHLHLHILPRWLGDTNFMTVTAETRVLPETLDISWQRLREAFANTETSAPSTQQAGSPAPDPQRRNLLKLSALAFAAAVLPIRASAQSPALPPAKAPAPTSPPPDPRQQRTWQAAAATLAENLHILPRFQHPVLVEGSVYPGIWQECGPHEGLVYGTLQPLLTQTDEGPTPLEIARNNHMAFFALQREDGQLPASVKLSDPLQNAGGYGQIQMVVPIAATAWELSQLTGDDELLVAAYTACSRWDAWLRQYRDTRKTGLVEGFCTYDTGHDNSPRWAGIPNRCPDADARKCPPLPSMPRLCPDLSATVYGARIALAHMATALGKPDEAARWHQDAEHLRQLIITKLYDPKDAAFYDLDAQNNFVRVRSDVISRVLGEHVLKLSDPRDKTIFDAVWTRQLHNPKAFWAPYPFPSIALDDPTFVRPIPRNSWGGASQALTALRTPRWMPHYGKQAEFDHLMRQWCEAIARHTEFRQQMDPLTGDFTQADPSGYSPAALVFLDFTRRLSHATT